MLRISKLTDYATVILSYLALDLERVLSAASIAREIHLSTPTVSKILKMLWQAGLVESFRGTGGGYRLAKAAENITIAEVVSAIEGQFAMTECSLGKNLCTLDALCGIKENWQIINSVILKALSGLTLADMTKTSSTKKPFPIDVVVEG